MTITEKKRLASEFIESMKERICGMLESAPESWDGHEIRLLCSREFENEVTDAMKKGRRRREFEAVYPTLPTWGRNPGAVTKHGVHEPEDRVEDRCRLVRVDAYIRPRPGESSHSLAARVDWLLAFGTIMDAFHTAGLDLEQIVVSDDTGDKLDGV